MVKQLKTRFFWKLKGNQWRLDVPRFMLETADKKWPTAVFSVFGDRSQDDFLQKLGLFIASADLQEASSLVQFFAPLPKGAGVLLAQAQMKGSLEQLSFFADLNEKHFAVDGRFTKINIAPSAGMPGIENLTGKQKAVIKRVVWIWTNQDARLTSLGIFRDALTITGLKGSIAWQQTLDDWIVSSPIVELDSPDLKTKTGLILTYTQKWKEKKHFWICKRHLPLMM